jgi:hypothetical protein
MVAHQGFDVAMKVVSALWYKERFSIFVLLKVPHLDPDCTQQKCSFCPALS